MGAQFSNDTYKATLQLDLDSGKAVESISGLFIRHAFFLDMDSGKVVDPTLSKTRPGEERRYLIAIDFPFDEFLKSIELLINDPDLRKEKAIQSKRFILTKFSWDKTKKIFNSIYN